MNLFNRPIDDAVKLLNTINNIQNDDRNDSYLAKTLGVLPKSLADAAIYIQGDRKFLKYFLLERVGIENQKV